MATKIFLNLPVKDLKKSMSFYSALGFKNNPQFTDDTAACMIVSEEIYVMLLTHPKFASFSPNPISDAKKNTEVMNALSCENRAAVDDYVRKAVASGGSTYNETKDYGFMYSHGFQDPDGHIWEVFYMDESHVQK